MTLGKRIVATLVASFLVSAALQLLERATESKTLFVLQFPGVLACFYIWGLHSGPENPAVWMIVVGAVNALAYWPLIFLLSFLFVRRGRRTDSRNLP